MSEVDNLENLSNADLRAKCKEFGLPNVPVTDSSRKVLIKKLRLSIGGESPTAQKKVEKNARRETIHVANKNAVTVGENNAPPNRPSNRRTIAAVSTASTTQPVEVTKVAAPAPVAEAQAERVTRRRSTSAPKEIPKLIERKIYPDVILESDDDEDNDLLKAAENAEKIHEKVKPLPERQSKIPAYTGDLKSAQAATGPSAFTASTTKENISSTRTYIGHQMKSSNFAAEYRPQPPAAEPLLERRTFAVPSTRPSVDYLPRYSSSQGLAAQTSGGYQYYSPTAGYNFGSSVSAPSAHMRSAPLAKAATVCSNEFSDDTEGNNDDGQSTPYVSTFLRNLERERLSSGGRSSSSYTAVGGGSYKKRYEVVGRTPRAEGKPSFFEALDRKYNIKRNLLLLLSIMVVVMLFVLFWK